MVILINIETPFTCDRITIIQGPERWEFNCNAILDKDTKSMTMIMNEATEIKLSIK